MKIFNKKKLKEKIKKIEKVGKELDKTGIWNFPKKFKKGIIYTIWKTK